MDTRKKTYDWKDQIYRAAAGVRGRVLEYTLKNNGGYLSQACSCAEILSALYLKIMNLNKVDEPIVPDKFRGVPAKGISGYRRGDFYNGSKSADLDRFILSPTHYSLVLYAVLVQTGRMSPSGLDEFNKDSSIVEMIGAEHSPGMEVMTGSLGQGISQAAGIALGRKLKGEVGKVWVFMSDGELQPGQVWEAIQSMSFYKLDNMGIYIDVNGYQCDGSVTSVMNIEPLEKKFESFGCRTARINGHDVRALVDAGKFMSDGRPLVVICDTCPWQGIEPIKKRAPKFHYTRFSNEEERREFEDVLEMMKRENPF